MQTAQNCRSHLSTTANYPPRPRLAVGTLHRRVGGGEQREILVVITSEDTTRLPPTGAENVTKLTTYIFGWFVKIFSARIVL